MRAHCLARASLVAVLDCNHHGLMFGDQTRGVFGGNPWIAFVADGPARDQRLADHPQKLAEARVVGGLGNHRVKGEIGL